MTENLRVDGAAAVFPGLFGNLSRNLTRRSGDEAPKEMAAPIAKGGYGQYLLALLREPYFAAKAEQS